MVAFPAVGSTFGRYKVTGVLGHGAMGVVLSARHEQLGRDVALKVLASDLVLRPEFRSRFRREAMTLARLYSPHVIDVYDYGENDGVLFIATQLVSGGDLRTWLERHGPMPPRQALNVMVQVAEAVSEAHDAGVVHRDIKPSNVLLRESGEEPFAYVCDFGIAQSNDEDRTRTVGVVGTYAYMAPERHQGSEATVASDIYSLGCLLWALLTGGPPYTGTDVQVAVQHISGDVPTYDGPPRVAAAVNAVLRRCLAKEPGQRYSTAAALRQDLRAAHRLTSDEEGGTSAEPGGVADPRPERGRRARVLWGGAATAAALAGAFLLVGPGGVLAEDDPCPGGRCAASGPPAETRKAGGGTSASASDTEGVCWRPAQLELTGECPDVKGLVGLRWAFPSLSRDFAVCKRQYDPKDDASVRTVFCPADGMAPREGVGYTEWRTVRAARKHFESVYDTPATPFVLGGRDRGFRWRNLEGTRSGFYKVAMLFRGYPFSATVRARDAEHGVPHACASLTARPPDTFTAYAVACGPRS